jgi:hypothetical protein
MEWVILAIVAVAILALALYRLSRRQTPASSVAKLGPSQLSAAEMLYRVAVLQDENAQWDAIWSQLNPSGSRVVQELLIEIRGPHMFAPHLGLGIIEDGCKRVLASSPAADGEAALREATRRANPFVQ